MTPEQIGLLTGVIGVIEKLWGWPAGVLLVAILIGPWVLSLTLNRAESKRFEAVVRMYENNVDLVKAYDRISQDQKDIIILNTQQWMAVREAVESNRFCPMIRLEKKIVSPGGVT